MERPLPLGLLEQSDGLGRVQGHAGLLGILYSSPDRRPGGGRCRQAPSCRQGRPGTGPERDLEHPHRQPGRGGTLGRPLPGTGRHRQPEHPGRWHPYAGRPQSDPLERPAGGGRRQLLPTPLRPDSGRRKEGRHRFHRRCHRIDERRDQLPQEGPGEHPEPCQGRPG